MSGSQSSPLCHALARSCCSCPLRPTVSIRKSERLCRSHDGKTIITNKQTTFCCCNHTHVAPTHDTLRTVYCGRSAGGRRIDPQSHLDQHIVDTRHATVILVSSVFDQTQVRIQIQTGGEVNDHADVTPKKPAPLLSNRRGGSALNIFPVDLRTLFICSKVALFVRTP